MAESIKDADEIQYPVFIICPQPGFKSSAFEDLRNKSGYKVIDIGADSFLWKADFYSGILQNVSSIPDTYMEMSYNLGEDWKIQVLLLDKR